MCVSNIIYYLMQCGLPEKLKKIINSTIISKINKTCTYFLLKIESKLYEYVVKL